MSSKRQLDVRHLNRWWRHLVNVYEVRQAWCLLQVKLYDPCLSALVRVLLCYGALEIVSVIIIIIIKALYKCSALLTLLYFNNQLCGQSGRIAM